ncbi:hypothetical protein [Staphylococcus pseudintermedius]|uniref:hypothetical protein n=1 Tax=Staphylococcus pseudintermedius TaxID=283734 RepID=UPI0036F42FF8
MQLDEFNLQAINFIKFDNYDESLDSAKSEDKDPKYEVFIEKNTSSVKIVFLHVTLETAEYNLNAMFKGVFKDINNESIDNKKLSSIALSLMLPLARPIIYQNLLQSNLNAVFLPILDIQRHLESYD